MEQVREGFAWATESGSIDMNWPVEEIQTSLGIRHPIVQAPMGGATSPDLTAAISNEGGFGMVAGISMNALRLREVIREVKERTARPFGVNVVFKDEVEPLVHIALEEQVKALSFFWGYPKDFVRRVQDQGCRVMHTVSSVEEAKRSVELGVDILVAQGVEAGGHVPGSVSTMVLVPAIVDAVSPVPVIAAGGIAGGRSIAAALALGASGCWIGTRFLGAAEASIHTVYREHLYAASETSTVYSQVFNKGWECPHRTLLNSTLEAWEAAGRPEPGERPGEADQIVKRPDGSLIERYTSATPHRDFTGEIEALPMWAGQGVHAVQRTQPAAEIFRQLVIETEECFNRLGGLHD